MRRPCIVVVVPPTGPARAHLLADTRELEQRARAALVERADLIADVALALGELLQALGDVHDEEAA